MCLLYEKIMNRSEKISLVGLGYVGMPIAVAFVNQGVDVVDFDLNKVKIDLEKSGITLPRLEDMKDFTKYPS